MIDFVSEQMGAGSSAIAAAASQALAATHYNVPGRRSSSLKASFEAISQGIATSQLSIGQVLNKGGGEFCKIWICNLRFQCSGSFPLDNKVLEVGNCFIVGWPF